jgi:flagellar biosynthesis GTPase FlhF
MQLPTIPKIGRLSRKHKITAAGAAAAAAVVLTVTGLQATGGTAVASGDPTGFTVAASAGTAQQVKSIDAQAEVAAKRGVAEDAAAKKKAAADAAAKKKAAAEAAAKKKAAAAAEAKRKAAAEAAAKKKAADEAAAQRAKAKQAATRSTQRAALKPTAAPAAAPTTAPAATTYTDDLDGWIKQAMSIMQANGIPGSYDGIYRNIMRESSGNPNAINLTDSNAAAGIPSKGLLQTIDPTFEEYHVAGTSSNVYDPVANIVAACNYAYHLYGSIDNVDSAY